MSDFLIGAMIGAAVFGSFVGLLMSRRRLPDDEFDGGFSADNPPPARTRIWSPHVISRED